MFLTERLKKNDYSEMTFYDEKEEIIGCVHPKFGRTVVWNDTVDFIFKPPSMHHISGEYSLFIKATLDENRFQESVQGYKVSFSKFLLICSSVLLFFFLNVYDRLRCKLPAWFL